MLSPEIAQLDPEDLQELMQNPSWEQVEQMLKSEPMLNYRVDIETDSTIKFDQEADKKSRLEFLQTAGGFLQQAMQIQNPDLAPLAGKMLEFGIRGFHVGKELETAFDVALEKLEKDANDPTKRPPNPEIQKIQGQMQLEQFKAQSEIQRLNAQSQVDNNQAQRDAELQQFKANLDNQLEMWKAKLDSETKIAVAQIKSKTQMQTTAMAQGDRPTDEGGQPLPSTQDLLVTVMQQLQQTLSGMAGTQQAVAQLGQTHQAMLQHMTRQKRIVRDQQGNIVGLQ